ncbi:MAG: hypothetical protein ACR2NO_11740 [Chloroflexota bacterium]
MRPLGSRICCIWLPGFGLHVAARLSPAVTGSVEHPSALYRPGTRYQELLECSPALARAGIRPGLPLREAQARVPDATFLPCDDGVLDAMERAFVPVLDALDSFSPVVEPPSRAQLGDGRAVAYVEVAGLEPLYGPEPQLAGRLIHAASTAAAVPITSASAGVASTKFTAWVAASLAAWLTPPVSVVPEHEDALFLAPLPLETIPLPVQARLALQRLGVRTLGAFAALPSNSVTLRLARYKDDGRRAHLLAQGLDDAPLCPRQPPPAASVARKFEWEETDLDRLTFALKRLADQLAARLVTPTQNVEEGEGFDTESDGDGVPLASDDAHPDFWPDEGPQLSADDLEPFPTRLAIVPLPQKPEITKQTPSRQAPPPPARRGYAAEALRVTWRLATGDTREAVLRLAEPSTTAAAFAEHLRWHAEGLDRFLADVPLPEPETSPDGFTYERMDAGIAVTAISLEALGLQVPPGTQLKLLASPIRSPGAPTDPSTHLDPLTRSRYARRAIARLQARWGPEVVRRGSLTTARLPERAYQLLDPALTLQLDHPAAAARPIDNRGDLAAPLSAPPPYWLLDPPESAAVLTPRKAGRRVLSLTRLRLRATIVRSGGPWKLVDPAALVEQPPLQRDYYHLETDDGRACLVYWDRTANAWYVQGLFD